MTTLLERLARWYDNRPIETWINDTIGRSRAGLWLTRNLAKLYPKDER